MKKLTTIFICSFLLTLPALAQLKVGVEAGMNLSHFKYSSENYAQRVGGMKAGFQVGATADYEFKKHWMLMSGIAFSQTQSSMKLAYSMSFYFPDTDIKINHLTVPLKVGYNLRINENFSLIPSVGIYGSYDFSAGKSSLDTQYPSDNGPVMRQDKWNPMKGYAYEIPSGSPHPYIASLGAFRHWTYGGIAELKAVICKHYTVGFSYYESIKKAQKQNDLRNYGLQLSVGYRF